MSGGNGTKILREDLDRPGHPRQEAERLIGPATARPAAERNLDMDPTDPIRRVSAVSTGQVLFDARHDRASVTDPGYFPGGMTGVLYGRLALFAIGPAETLTAGLSHDADLLEPGHVPGAGRRRRLRDATAMINTMRLGNPGLVILPAHDPAAARRLAQATGQVPTSTTAQP
jgi:hypothetical protein